MEVVVSEQDIVLDAECLELSSEIGRRVVTIGAAARQGDVEEAIERSGGVCFVEEKAVVFSEPPELANEPMTECPILVEIARPIEAKEIAIARRSVRIGSAT